MASSDLKILPDAGARPLRTFVYRSCERILFLYCTAAGGRLAYPFEALSGGGRSQGVGLNDTVPSKINDVWWKDHEVGGRDQE